MALKDRSEYDGEGPMPNTVYPKGPEALTASDKLRLQSITGQETDPNAPVDPYFWHGNVRPDDEAERARLRQFEQAGRQLRQMEEQRYKESPY